MKIPYVKNGEVGYLDELQYGFVESDDDLELEPFVSAPVGFIAIQYGFGYKWQKTPDGTWEAIS